ncbi:MAG: hypothetical protein ACRD0O_18880, partial [Acidimicrobiia bacterium]
MLDVTRTRWRGRAVVLAVALLSGGNPVGLPAAPAAVPDSPGAFSYLHSSDGGRSFTPLELQDQSVPVGLTHVDAEGGVVHAVYDSGDNDDAPRQVRYRRSTDGGKTFAASRHLDVVDDRGTPANGDSSESDLDADGDHVAVVWEDDKLLAGGDPDPCCAPDHPVDNPSDENRDDIFWSSSTDAGKSFSPPVNITGTDDVHNRDPDVVIDDRFVAVVYEGDDVVRQAATDGNDILFQA